KSLTAALQPARDWMEKQDVAGASTHNGVKAGLAMMLAGPGGGVGSSTEGQEARMKETFAEVEKNVQLIAFGASIEKEGHNRLLQRISEVCLAFYAEKDAKQSGRGALLAQVDDASAFVKDAIALLKKAEEASAKKGHTEVKFQQKEIAGKTAHLITIKGTGEE